MITLPGRHAGHYQYSPDNESPLVFFTIIASRISFSFKEIVSRHGLPLLVKLLPPLYASRSISIDRAILSLAAWIKVKPEAFTTNESIILSSLSSIDEHSFRHHDFEHTRALI